MRQRRAATPLTTPAGIAARSPYMARETFACLTVGSGLWEGREAAVIPKIVVPALGGAAMLFAGQTVMATDYRPDEFFGLDLSKAVLSPKRLGPAAEFARLPVQASSDHASEPAWARKALNTEPKQVAVQRVA